MGVDLEQQALIPVADKLSQGDLGGATSLLAGVVVGALTGAPAMSPVTTNAINGFANLIAKNTRDFLEAGERVDSQRAAMAALREAVSHGLNEARTADERLRQELHFKSRAQLLLVVDHVHSDIARRLDALRKHIEDTIERRSMGRAWPDADERLCRLHTSCCQLSLPAGSYRMGRSTEADLMLGSLERGVSRIHAKLNVAAEGATIEDLGSRNGTRVQGNRIVEVTRIAHGHELRLGGFQILFYYVREDLVATPEKDPDS